MPKTSLEFGRETLGTRLARLRKDAGFTQAEFAKKVGITQGLVSSYETGRFLFSAETAVRFALALGVSLDELLHPKARKRASKKPSLRVQRRMEQIEALPLYEQRALLITIDKFLAAAQGG